jgi:hypothetical protein
MASSEAEESKTAKTASRLADAAQPYPPYTVALVGLGEEKVLTGTHFSTIEHSDPKLSVRLEHLETEFEDGPVLRISFERKP